MIKSFKELIVWQRSMEAELYALTSQMRRAAVSVPSNIAEGYKRRNLGECIQFLNIADASAAELETQILLAQELYKIDFAKYTLSPVP